MSHHEQPYSPEDREISIHADPITIGEALEVTGDQPVGVGDAAAIQAAEVRATGCSQVAHGGLSSIAQFASTFSLHIHNIQDKVTLGDVLENATVLLGADKEVTREDAEKVMSAEMRNQKDDLVAANPHGVGATVATAATLNPN